ETLAARRAVLNGHNQALHTRREPWGVSVFEAQAALAALAPGIRPMTPVRLRGPVLAALDAQTARRTREQLREVATLGGFTLIERDSGWIGARVHTPEEAQQAFEMADRLAEHTLPEARPALAYVVEETGLRPAIELADWRRLFTFLESVQLTLNSFQPEVFR